MKVNWDTDEREYVQLWEKSEAAVQYKGRRCTLSPFQERVAALKYGDATLLCHLQHNKILLVKRRPVCTDQ